MSTRATHTLRMLGIVALLGACFALGCTASRTGTTTESPASSGAAQLPDGATSDGGAVGGAVESQSPERAALDAATVPSQDTLVISTAGIDVEVEDLDSAVAAVRALATKYGASIANLSTSAGDDPGVGPQPLDGSSAQYAPVAPGGASITLRVPAAKLAAAERDIAALGRVISQTSSQDDVTQQHVDMRARLKNLQAEESRLRTFFLKAKRVSEMLAIETELSRVRGEIESMQAQIDYLERQAALATLTVSLSQPGALVSPAGGGWGFGEAVREGVRAAATVVRGAITLVLALSPLLVLGLVLFVVIRALIVRRRKGRANSAVPTEDVMAGDDEDGDSPTSQS